MRPRGGVDLLNRSQRRLPEPTFEACERRPEAAVDVGHLPRDQAADEHLARRSHGAGEPEELLAPRMPPPAAPRAAVEGGFEQARHGATRGLEHDAVLGDEAESLAGSHWSGGASPTPWSSEATVPRRRDANRCHYDCD